MKKVSFSLKILFLPNSVTIVFTASWPGQFESCNCTSRHQKFKHSLKNFSWSKKKIFCGDSISNTTCGDKSQSYSALKYSTKSNVAMVQKGLPDIPILFSDITRIDNLIILRTMKRISFEETYFNYTLFYKNTRLKFGQNLTTN